MVFFILLLVKLKKFVKKLKVLSLMLINEDKIVVIEKVCKVCEICLILICLLMCCNSMFKLLLFVKIGVKFLCGNMLKILII